MTGQAGILYPPEDAPDLDVLATEVLDDALYNILHDLVMKTHRDEKLARAATAAIRVEKQAADATDGSLDVHPEVRTETDAAIYEEGRVTLKGNPLKTVKEIVCPKCHLPRLQHPTEGKGAQKPDPSVIYCKRMPFISKPNHDIYGQTWVPLGPGRGKKKKDMEKRTDIPADQKPANLLSYPSATCSKCKRCILVTRLNNHMGSCIGNSGRVAGRAAAQKISSANASTANSQHEPTPPLSRRGTPIPPVAGADSTSTRKRGISDVDASGDADTADAAAAEPAADPAPGPKRKKTKMSAALTGKFGKAKGKSTTPVPPPPTASILKLEKERDREAAAAATAATAATAAAAASTSASSAGERKSEREEGKRKGGVSESPIVPPNSLSPGKGGVLNKKQKPKTSSPLKKVTKVKPPGGAGKKARDLGKAEARASPAR
ncbi:hypothetical protein TD95_005212 [Thielaviopsis punctulata]|uniref:Transcriptional activator n=1 Tax=Thielaviopsis punctulata TaxID=72032 RepID=A0A0F4ZKL0_9PEZI|nr:hypothetical protein TD95_005212 [Thielaviopsis punctulata]